MKIDFYKLFGCLSWLNYIWWLLELNIVMLAVNLPLVMVLFLAEAEMRALPVLLVTGITIGPSMLAAFEAMPYIEDGIVRHYFRALKGSWKRCLKIWIPIWLLAIVMTADIMILEKYQVMEPLKWCTVILLLFLASFVLGFFLVWAQWGQKAKDAVALTCKISFVKPLRFHLNLLILLGTVVLLSQKQIYLLLYGVALSAFLIHKNFMPIAQFVNQRPENQDCEACSGDGKAALSAGSTLYPESHGKELL